MGPMKIKANTICSVAGWGFKTMYGPLSLTLREAEVKIMKKTDCQRRWSEFYAPSLFMCVYGDEGSCNVCKTVTFTINNNSFI